MELSIAGRRKPPWVWLLGAFLWSLVLGLFLSPVLPKRRSGRMVCSGCAAVEWQRSLGPFVHAREPLSWEAESWWSSSVPPDHEHSWEPVGCHTANGIGMTVTSCHSTRKGSTFLGTLPRFKDQELARSVAERLLAMTPDQRWRQLLGSQALEGLPGLLVEEQGVIFTLDSEEERRRYSTWLDAHPEWSDLFPATLP